MTTTPPVLKPWTRFWARNVDLNVFIMLLQIIVFGVNSGWGNQLINNQVANSLFWLGNVVVWIFIEAALLSTWGTTPGKWFLGVKITDQQGKKLEFIPALRRSFNVWLKGMGVGVPLFSLFTWIYCYGELKKHHVTSWDREGHFVITFEKTNTLKVVLLSVLMVSVMLTLAYLVDYSSGLV